MSEGPAQTNAVTPKASDLQAIDEVLRGNREMFEVLVRRYNRQLFRIGTSYLGQRERVEDAMQNAYLKAFLNLRRFRRESSFSTWLTRIMINECLMILRRFKGVSEVPLELAPEGFVAGRGTGTSSLNLKDMKILLETVIASLPLKLRSVYMLREIEQLSTAETAACLEISEENVKVTLHRARQRMKDELLQSTIGVELFPYSARFCDPMTERVMSAVLGVD